jgi:hypothetical protein
VSSLQKRCVFAAKKMCLRSKKAVSSKQPNAHDPPEPGTQRVITR